MTLFQTDLLYDTIGAVIGVVCVIFLVFAP